MGYAHIDNLYRAPEILECFALEKIHGTSAHVSILGVGAIQFSSGGAKHEAQRSLAALQDQYPDLTVLGVQQALPPMSVSYRNRLFDALHTVGLPA